MTMTYPVLSLTPEEAVSFLAQLYSTVVVVDPPEFVRRYRGRVLIHSLPFPDHPHLQELCLEFLAAYGFDPATFPSLAIQGVATIVDVYPYDPDRFCAEEAEHGCGESLYAYQLDYAVQGEVWGVRLEHTYFLDAPVTDILPPPGTEHGDFWLPQTTSQLRGVEQALLEDAMHCLTARYNDYGMGLWLRWIEQAPPKR